MKLRINNEFIIINCLVIALILVINFLPIDILHVILSLPFILFFPGYTVLAIVFPEKDGMGNADRIIYSLTMSIVLVVLIGIVLNYTPMGITVGSVLYSVSSVIFVTSTVAWIRRRKLPEEDRFSIRLSISLWSQGTKVSDKILHIALIVSVLAAAGMLFYTIANPRVSDDFTEFYILGPDGTAAEYPKELAENEEGNVIAGIINHEYAEADYYIEVQVDGEKVDEIGPITLERDEAWENEISFSIDKAGDNQKVTFLLRKDSMGGPSVDYLHLWINVTPQ